MAIPRSAWSLSTSGVVVASTTRVRRSSAGPSWLLSVAAPASNWAPSAALSPWPTQAPRSTFTYVSLMTWRPVPAALASDATTGVAPVERSRSARASTVSGVGVSVRGTDGCRFSAPMRPWSEASVSGSTVLAPVGSWLTGAWTGTVRATASGVWPVPGAGSRMRWVTTRPVSSPSAPSNPNEMGYTPAVPMRKP